MVTYQSPIADTFFLSEAAEAGLQLLRIAHLYAQDTGEDIWEYALEIDELRRHGLTNNEFRWLLARDLVEHARETTAIGSKIRKFEALPGRNLPHGTCFVPTRLGLAAIQDGRDGQSEKCLKENSQRVAGQTFSPGKIVANASARPTTQNTHREAIATVDSQQAAGSLRKPQPAAATNTESSNAFADAKQLPIAPEVGPHVVPLNTHTPIWNPLTRQLSVGGEVIKTYRWPAMNQETVLAVFHEEGWPERIDDPLPVVPEQDPKRRLHDTIKCLNRSQTKHRIQFRGDGTGAGVKWEMVDSEEKHR